MRPFYSLAVVFAAALVYGCSGPAPMVQETVNEAVVARFAGEEILFDELVAEYERSAGLSEEPVQDTLGAYEDFLDRYVNYRLKVLEAQAAGYDKDPETLAEIDGYRTQYARPYLLDRTVLDPIVRSLYARQREAVDVSHILIQVPNNASPADTLAAYEKLSAIADSIRGGADFGELAARHSEDPSASGVVNTPGYHGRLGYIIGGSTVKPFEDAAYDTKTGELSDIVRTRFGYHLVKVHGRRDTPGDVRISHIMITPQGQSPADSAAAVARLDTVVTSLDNGADFAALAAIYSSDQQSASRGGDLGFITFGSRFVQEMKDVAFGMEEIGAVSDPVETRYGFHLIKLTDRKEPISLEESYDELKTRASRMPEALFREWDFADSMLVVRGAVVDTSVADQYLAPFDADSLLNMEPIPDEWRSFTVATLGDSTYSLADYVAKSPWQRYTDVMDIDEAEVRRRTLTDYMRSRLINYEMSALEDSDADFARTIQEFRNGILLFSLMEDSVWTAAAEDSAGLAMVYNENPSQYVFPDREIVVGVYSRSIDLVNASVSLISGGLTPDAAIDSLGARGAIEVDTTYIAGTSNSIYDRALSQEVGSFSTPISYNNGYIALYHAGTDRSRVKSVDEARAELVNSLQERYEDRLVARLRSKYNAETYPARLPGLLGMDMPSTDMPSTESGS